ncbi:MAG: hypothetical protein ABIG61_17760 [Planctomycetota bacterium]
MVWDATRIAENTLAPDYNNQIRENNTQLEAALDNEHEFATGGDQAGYHVQGSARCFFADTAPSTRIDGTAFEATDYGCIWIDSNSSPDNQFNILTGHSPVTWTPISNEIIAVAVAAIHTWADVQTFSVNPVFTEGIVANNAYLQARNAADDGNVDLIKSDGSDVPTLPDGSALATSAAPTADAEIANKKYVDDSLTFSPTKYAGGESVTLPNGLILKFGQVTGAGTWAQVTFGTAFPTAIVQVIACAGSGGQTDATTDYGLSTFTLATTGFVVAARILARLVPVRWIAIGY